MCVVRDSVDRVQSVGDFRLIGRQCVVVIDTRIGRVEREATDLDQQAADFVQSALRRLNNGDGLFRILDRLTETGDLCTLLFGNYKCRRSIGAPVHL